MQVGSAAFGADTVALAATAFVFGVVALTTTGAVMADRRVMATSVAVRVMTGSRGRAQPRLHGERPKATAPRRCAVAHTRDRLVTDPDIPAVAWRMQGSPALQPRSSRRRANP